MLNSAAATLSKLQKHPKVSKGTDWLVLPLSYQPRKLLGREMGRWLSRQECLPYKHEDLSLNPRFHIKSVSWEESFVVFPLLLTSTTFIISSRCLPRRTVPPKAWTCLLSNTTSQLKTLQTNSATECWHQALQSCSQCYTW